ncbi:MAG: hypothetical protein WCI04_00175 [archaeon]
MLLKVSGTYNVLANLGFTQLQQNELYFECDTSVAPVTIIIPQISDFGGYLNTKIYVSDLSNNAFNNNITIIPSGGDTINQGGGVVIDINNGTFAFWIASTSQWIGLDSHTYTSTAYYTIEDEGTPVVQRTTMNFVGDGVSVSDVSGKTQIDIPIQPAYATIQEEGVSVTQRTTMNFVGDGVTVSDNGGKTQVNVPIQQAYTTVQDEGTSVTQRSTLNFVGDGVTVSDVGGKTEVNMQSYYTTVQEGGVSVTQRSTTNFVGDGVTVSDVGGKTQVNVPIQPAYATIQDEGVALPQRQIIDFQGLGVQAQDVGGKTVVTVLSGLPATVYGLYSQTANSFPVTATIVEGTLIGAGVGTLSVPANGFFVGGSFNAKLNGHISCVGSATIQVKIKANSVVLGDTGIIALDTTTNKHWQLDLNFTIRSIGGVGVGSIVSSGFFGYIKNAGTNFEGANFITINNTTFDTTILNTLVVTAQWNTTNAGNSIYSDIFVLNKIY